MRGKLFSVRRCITLLLVIFTLFNLAGCEGGLRSYLENQFLKDSQSDTGYSPENTELPGDIDETEKIENNTSLPKETTEVTESPIATEPPAPVFIEQVKFSSDIHSPIEEKDYYQKSVLDEDHKQVYNLIADAAKKGHSEVTVTQYACSPDEITDIYYRLQADYPQFFYLSGYFSYTTSAFTGNVKKIYLIYFDGKTTDEYNNKLEYSAKADREVIAKQIKTFNKKIDEIVKLIPVELSEYEKEKLIYEYLQDNIVYDEVSGKTPPTSYSDMNTHAFDSYGAACENSAVCEGYAELFQYLCYCVGIQATVVRGKTTRASHMWNAICIDSEWYMADPTWDDYDDEGFHSYSYFNVTTKYMEDAEHTIDKHELSVPECISDKYSFYNTYALRIDSLRSAPANYKEIIDYVVSRGEKYMCVYVGNQTGDIERYFQNFIYSWQSDVQRYISSKRYPIKISTSFYNVKDVYHYVEIEYK